MLHVSTIPDETSTLRFNIQNFRAPLANFSVTNLAHLPGIAASDIELQNFSTDGSSLKVNIFIP